MKKYNSFSLIEKIAFERLGGSPEELKAAKIIQKELKKDNIESTLETFLVDHYEVKEVSLKLLEPYEKSFTATGYGMSGSTPPEGIKAPLVYIENGFAANLVNLKGKIVLINGRMPYKLYEDLIKEEVAGFISLSGSVYDDINSTDLEERTLRERHYEKGKIPGVTIRMSDGEELIKNEGKIVELKLIQKEGKRQSQNVIATIEGTLYKDKIIGVSAHYDSVRFSTGAYDNATGSATILELIRYFKENPPLRTLKFMWFGSEEMGLLGAKAYCLDHKDKINDYEFVVNVDMTGVVLGYDIAVCTAEEPLVNYIDYLGKKVGFPIKARQGVYSSDSTPFADVGVPALSFARISPRGGAEIHSKKDVMDFLDEKNYYKTAEFIIDFTERIANSIVMPISRTIPEAMKKELDYYMGRKQRPEK